MTNNSITWNICGVLKPFYFGCICSTILNINEAMVNSMRYAKLQKPWYFEDKFIINSMTI